MLARRRLRPDDQQPAGPVPTQHGFAEQRAPGRDAVALAEREWVALLQDERVQALVRTTLDHNAERRIAAARGLEAQAQREGTRSFLRPTMDRSAAVSRARVIHERLLPVLTEVVVSLARSVQEGDSHAAETA
jgi:outer membrane protein TolC